MTPGPASDRRRRASIELAVLVLLAYLPALTAAPGKVPADTKLYLYLDPGRQIADALWSYEARQLAGWVPHQTIGYLWPTGPWYWVFEHLGVPDWVAHRLWIGTILLLAGAGLRWGARRLGLGAGAVMVAAVAYQLSPYVLPYISRTSVLLLPWAALGWLVGLTVGAATRTRWRDAALFALVVASVGGINATALVMIAPAPLLWLVDAAARGAITWRRGAITAVKIGGLSLAVSMWWMAALAVQARFGAPALSYSETLEAVSFTATATEVLRGLGYWLFYVRDPVAAATTAARVYQESPLLIAAGLGLVVAGLAGLALTRWGQRRFAALCVLVGLVLAVGAHPIDDPSPLGSPLAGSSRSTIVLALRSSTRAVPLVVFGVALGLAALAGALGARRARLGMVGAAAVMVVAALNLPALWTGAYVDPELEHPENLPSWWSDAAAALDGLPAGYRVLQVPGVESAIYRWGYTVDPPLPGLSDRQLVTRDWLPLGSPAAMDTLYALDDRFQAGVVEPDAIAPIARLFGADTVMVVPEVAFERFRTPRPELTWERFEEGVADLGEPTTFGPPAPNTAPAGDPPASAMVDERSVALDGIGEAVPPIALLPVEEPLPIVRAGGPVVLVVGDGDGVVDAAAAGLVDGTELLRYAAAVDDVADAAEGADLVIVTDSNRRRARQWRGSQDVWGYTEDGTEPAVLDDDPADHRLEVFPDQTLADQTLAVQRGPVRAVASSYGEPLAYRPEDRAAMAVDGSLSTAWLVADRAEPIGQRIRVDATAAVDELTLVQPQDTRADRWITAVRLTTSSGEDRIVILDDRSRQPSGQLVELTEPAIWWELEIAATNTPRARTYPNRGPVGFAEIETELGPSQEVVVVPSTVTAGADTPLAIVLTRLRTDPLDRWRDDPEAAIVRAITLDAEQELTVTPTVRLDRRASDDMLADLFGVVTATADERLAGDPSSGGWAAVDGDADTAWITPFAVGSGSTLTVPVDPAVTVDELEISLPAPRTGVGRLTEVVVRNGDAEVTATLDPADPDGRYRIALPGAVAGTESISITTTASDAATTTDRRYGEITLLPVAIAEVTGPGITPAPLPDRLATDCRDDLLTIDGEPVPIRVSASTDAALAGEVLDAEVCGSERVTLPAGEHLVRSSPGSRTGLDVDRVVLTNPAAEEALAAPASERPEVTVSSGRDRRTITVGPCPDGCWVVQGEGWNPGWSATLDGESLGDPEQVSGGMNGWWLAPSSEARTVELRWKPQRWIWIGLGASALGVVACVVLVAIDRRRGVAPAVDPAELVAPWMADGRRHHVVWVAGAAVSALVVAPVWGAAVLAVALPLVLLRRSRLLAVAGLVGLAACAAFVVLRQLVQDPPAGFGWVLNSAPVHRPALAAVIAIVAAALPGPRRADARAGANPTTSIAGS